MLYGALLHSASDMLGFALAETGTQNPFISSVMLLLL